MVRKFAFLLAFAAATPAFADAPLLQTNGQRVDGQYIVMFKSPFVMAETAQQMRGMGAQINDMWDGINGASVRMTRAQLDAALAMDGVSWIEEQAMYYVSANPAARQITNAGLYGLDVISNAPGGRNNVFDAPANGAGVDVYVIDTGIRPTHQQFQGHFMRGANFAAAGPNDCNLHGTHVSGTATGLSFGVAPAATIRDVRVFGCDGGTTNAIIINGLRYVSGQQTARNRRAVANMSLGGPASQALDVAVNNMAASGVRGLGLFVAVAAGNENQNASRVSPARAASAFAVGATTNTNARAGFSNFGAIVRVFAPGSNILSAAFESDAGTRTISGTSMASPHVAGAAALLLERFPNETSASIGNRIMTGAIQGRVTGITGATASPNRLLNVDAAGTPLAR